MLGLGHELCPCSQSSTHPSPMLGIIRPFDSLKLRAIDILNRARGRPGSLHHSAKFEQVKDALARLRGTSKRYICNYFAGTKLASCLGIPVLRLTHFLRNITTLFVRCRFNETFHHTNSVKQRPQTLSHFRCQLCREDIYDQRIQQRNMFRQLDSTMSVSKCSKKDHK